MVLACAVLLVGCGDGDSSAATKTTTVTVTVTPSTAESLAPVAPLTMGQEAHLTGNGVDLAVTVFAVDQNSVPNAPKPQTPGRWVGADVQLCAKQAPPTGPIIASWSLWTVSDAQYGNYEASSLTYQQFPTPQYPVGDPVAVGDCVRGWVLFPVGEGVDVTAVKFRPSSASQPITWAV